MTEFCAEVSDNLNDLAARLGLPSRVWYVTVIDGKVLVNRYPNGAIRFFGKRRTAPGHHAWGW